MNNKLFTKPTGFGQITDGTVARCPEREAIVYKDWRITYGEMGKLINQTAHYLRSLGLTKGSRLSVISRTAPNAFSSRSLRLSSASSPSGLTGACRPRKWNISLT